MGFGPGPTKVCIENFTVNCFAVAVESLRTLWEFVHRAVTSTPGDSICQSSEQAAKIRLPHQFCGLL